MRVFTRITSIVLFLSLASGAYAQSDSFEEFLQKYFKVDASDAQAGPKLHAQFRYSAADNLITRSEVKVDNDGFEDHMAFGFAQRIGGARTKVTYNIHRYSYSTWEDENRDVAMDVVYKTLHLQHRLESSEHVTSLGFPFNISAAHFDLAFSQTQQYDTLDTINAYQFVSRLHRLKVSATWKAMGPGMWANFSTEYHPSSAWSMQYSYSNDDTLLQRRIRSMYSTRAYRLAGEYASTTDTANQTYITGAVGIEKDMKLAAVSLRYEYDGSLDNKTVFLTVETHNVF
ncbi:MAG: hypothetical protein GC149_11820 [Gammaproteobacteria bacterium]|nr:hypothetical protein [Gammaproteobacteria bacterium]